MASDAEPFQEVKPKRGPGRPRKVPVVAEPLVPLVPLVPEAVPPISEHSLRDVLDRLDDMEKRLTPKPRAPRARAVKPVPLVQEAVQEQSGMSYLNGRRANKSMYHSFMPP